MTYVEFFSRTALDNVCSCLAQEPEKIIYIGGSQYQMKEFISRCKPVFESEIDFTCRKVDLLSLNDIVKVLSAIVESEPECAFDLTGGPDLALVAMGIVAERYREKGIQMHRFIISDGDALDCDQDGVTLEQKKPVSLRAEQLVRLHGGALAKERMEETWELDRNLEEAITIMWNLAKGNPGYWNLRLDFLAKADNLRDQSMSTDRKIVTPIDAFPNPAALPAAIDRAQGLLQTMQDTGLVESYELDKSPLVVEYRDRQIRRCMSKAGNILELKVYAAAKTATDDKKELVYTDCVNGAVIDWVGNEPADDIDPVNEIDLILMKGMQPVFISCKNGVFGVDELYKFSSVTDRFGGKYAKKVLISAKPVNEPDLQFRAQELGIRLLENVMSMTDKEFEKKIAALWSE